MNCERTVEELTAYLDGELTEDMVRLVAAHLDGCPACAAELRSLRSAANMVTANVAEIEPRPEIWHNVRARLSARPSSPQRKSWPEVFLGWQRLALATAAVIALTVGIWAYFRYQNSQGELNEYMSRYIQFRELQDQEIAVEPARNPFSVVNFSPEENPFRAEDR